MRKLSLILGLVLATTAAHSEEAKTAQDTTSTIKKSDVVPNDKAKKDIDEEITNAKMRAESGSKSKYSFRSSFGYNGSNLQKPLDVKRPALDPKVATSGNTSLVGSVGMKARLTDHQSLSASVGLQLNKPLAGGDLSEKSKFDIADPSLSYDYVAKIGGVQSVSNISISASTTKFARDNGELGQFGVGETMIYSTPAGVDLGLALDMNATINGNNVPADEETQSSLSAYSVGLYPFLEYAFTDAVSFRTVFRYTTYTSSFATPNKYENNLGSQSMGIGFAATRDIYFYPNIQFVPSNFVSEKTNWGISASINL